VCAQFVAVCREIGLLTKASVAIDGSKFKAVNNRDKNFTRAKMERRLAQIRETDEWVWESATEFCATLDRYAGRTMEIKRAFAPAAQIFAWRNDTRL
jgi:hypothetical protein